MERAFAIFAASFALWSAAAFAVPDYVAHQERFDFAAKVATSVKSCGHFGYAIDEAAAKRLVDDALTSAVEDGVPVDMAHRMGLVALREETERQDYLSARVTAARKDGAQAEQTALDRFLAYWEGRCRSLSADPRAAPFFKPPAR